MLGVFLDGEGMNVAWHVLGWSVTSMWKLIRVTNSCFLCLYTYLGNTICIAAIMSGHTVDGSDIRLTTWDV